MKIHEYQAKELFRKYGIPVPAGGMATTVSEAAARARELPGLPAMVKAQVHAGGRGRGGGIKRAATPAEVEARASELLAMTLITPQTGPAGRMVRKILIEQAQNIARELYLAILPDRASARIMIMAGAAGGMAIEELAATDPDKIVRVTVDPRKGLQPADCREVVGGLGLKPVLITGFTDLLERLYLLFVECDCTLVEINPLAATSDDRLVALDAKMEIDDNALFRQPALAALRDPDQEDPLEAAAAAAANLNYIRLDGNVGIMVNGAGLAMATMDLIKNNGAEPANFLDVGGGARAEKVEKGLQIILADPKVKGILINIFGGILRCDVLAAGVVEAARKNEITVPMVVRLAGTNAAEGKKILAGSGLDLIIATDLSDAAGKITQIVNNGSNAQTV
ncbi:MAG: ADP-forming succinate--CoA ligase subunit beta [Desulfobacterales bacterium]|nr:ADP-forming succinate--CoA ligase subunit beta [Desulfobacterales bacterium]